jgi:hypothetical protein
VYSILHTFLLLACQTIKVCPCHWRWARIPSNDTSKLLLPSDGTYPFAANGMFSTDGTESDSGTWE